MKIDIIEFNTPTQMKEEIKRQFNLQIEEFYKTEIALKKSYLFINFVVRCPIDQLGRFVNTGTLVSTAKGDYVFN